MKEDYTQYIGKWVTCDNSPWEDSYVKFSDFDGDDSVMFNESYDYGTYSYCDLGEEWCDFDMSTIRVISVEEMRKKLNSEYDLEEFDEHNTISSSIVLKSDVLVKQQKAIV